jgi:hypothetical protein
MWFELNQDELSLLLQKKSIAGKVDLILQLGYFKAKNQFFNFKLEDVKEAASYILNRYFLSRVLEKFKVGRESKRLN